MHCRSPTLRFCEKNPCSYAPFGLSTEAVQLTQFRHMPNQPNAAPRTPWIQVGVFIAAFLLLQSGWSLARGTVLERVAINDATVVPAAWLVNQLTPGVHAVAVQSSVRALGGGINVLNGCEGVEVLFLLIAALLIAPITPRRRAYGLVAGALFVWLLNQGRILVLFYANRSDKELFSLLHGTVAPLVMIVLVTLAYVSYVSTSASK